MYLISEGLLREMERLARFAQAHARQEREIRQAIRLADRSMPSESVLRFVKEQARWVAQYRQLIEKPQYVRELERQQLALLFIERSYPTLKVTQADSEAQTYLATSDEHQKTPIENAGNVALVRSLLQDISADDCFEFVNFLSELPFLGFKREVGKKIHQYIGNQVPAMTAGSPVFRIRISTSKKTIAYTKNEMFEPMFTIPKQNRFSSAGQNPLYLSGDLEAAKYETGVTEKSRYTWLKLQFARSFRLLNVTDESIPIFNYCHKKTEQSDLALKTEYLIPSFISDCAKDLGFDGLVYNSVHQRSVKNYALFDAGKSDFDILEILWCRI